MKLVRYTVKATFVPGKYLVVADTLLILQPMEKNDDSVTRFDLEIEFYIDAAVSNI